MAISILMSLWLIEYVIIAIFRRKSFCDGGKK